jgi:hypothetical protein
MAGHVAVCKDGIILVIWTARIEASIPHGRLMRKPNMKTNFIRKATSSELILKMNL